MSNKHFTYELPTTKDIVKYLKDHFCSPFSPVRIGRILRNKKSPRNYGLFELSLPLPEEIRNIDKNFWAKVSKNWRSENKANMSYAINLVRNDPKLSSDFLNGLNFIVKNNFF